MVGRKRQRLRRLIPMAVLASLYLSAAMFYYRTMRAFGVHEKEILMERVSESRNSQADAETHYYLAVKSFREIIDFDGGRLKQDDRRPRADRERRRRERRRPRTRGTDERVAFAKRTADGLLEEWGRGLKEYSNSGPKRSGEDVLEQSRERYSGLALAVGRAKARMPAAPRFWDQVSSLGRGLDDRTVSPVRGAADELESYVKHALKELEKPISEANEFIEQML